MAGSSGWRYGTVSVTFWNDAKARGWTMDGRFLALYLLTGPTATGEGFYPLPFGLAADDLSWTAERLEAAFAELTGSDFADVDRDARLVFVVKALKYTAQIKGPKSITGAINALEKSQGSPRLFARFLLAADHYQPDFAAEIRAHYKLPDGDYAAA